MAESGRSVPIADRGKLAAGLRPTIESKRANEKTAVCLLTAAVRDGYFTFLGTCWPLGATLPEKSP